jgi:hypothetical protein
MTAWSPPAGWRELPSRVEGFAVWGPPEEAAPDGPVAVRCPQCGAAAGFDVARGAVGCSFCGWAAEKRPEVVGRDAGAGAFTRDALARGSDGFGVDRRELACRSCGAVLALEAGALSATCPFCASNEVAIRDAPTVQGLRPTAILPFAIQAAACRDRAAAWLGSGWLHPADLGRVARVDAFVGIYVPFWTFSADVASTWRAEVGHERTEHYRDPATGEQKHRTVIDWRWEDGSARTEVRDLLVPGTTRLSARLLGQLTGGFALDRLAVYDPTLLAGFQAQTYDVALPDAWERGRHEMRERARRDCHANTGSSHVRSFSMTADLQGEAWRHVLLPIWVSAYRYAGKTWMVMVDGSTGQVVGQKPVEWWKVWAAIAALLTPGLALMVVGIPLLLLAIGAVVLPIGLVLFVAGAIGSGLLYAHATASEAA